MFQERRTGCTQLTRQRAQPPGTDSEAIPLRRDLSSSSFPSRGGISELKSPSVPRWGWEAVYSHLIRGTTEITIGLPTGSLQTQQFSVTLCHNGDLGIFLESACSYLAQMQPAARPLWGMTTSQEAEPGSPLIRDHPHQGVLYLSLSTIYTCKWLSSLLLFFFFLQTLLIFLQAPWGLG